MLTGAIMGKTAAYRQELAWGHVGTEKPAGYPTDQVYHFHTMSCIQLLRRHLYKLIQQIKTMHS